jgi:hypothetical protein
MEGVGDEVGVTVGGTEVAVGGTGVAVGGTDVAVGGGGVTVDGSGVLVARGAIWVAVAGADVTVGSTDPQPEARSETNRISASTLWQADIDPLPSLVREDSSLSRLNVQAKHQNGWQNK